MASPTSDTAAVRPRDARVTHWLVRAAVGGTGEGGGGGVVAEMNSWWGMVHRSHTHVERMRCEIYDFGQDTTALCCWLCCGCKTVHVHV